MMIIQRSVTYETLCHLPSSVATLFSRSMGNECVGGCTRGAWLKWRIKTTVTLSNYATCSSGGCGSIPCADVVSDITGILCILCYISLFLSLLPHPPPTLSLLSLSLSLSPSPSHRTHMQDLKDFTQDVHYENFRKKKLLEGSPAAMGVGGGMEASPSTDAQRIMMEKEKQVRHVTSHMTTL